MLLCPFYVILRNQNNFFASFFFQCGLRKNFDPETIPDKIYWNTRKIKKKSPPPTYNVVFCTNFPKASLGKVGHAYHNIVVGGRGIFLERIANLKVVPNILSMIVVFSESCLEEVNLTQ